MLDSFSSLSVSKYVTLAVHNARFIANKLLTPNPDTPHTYMPHSPSVLLTTMMGFMAIL